MEKPRKTRNFRKFIRLLICFVILTFSFSSQIWAHIYSNVIFTPIDEYIFANSDAAFEAVIPNVKPTDVLITVQTLPENVSFVSSDKTEILDQEGRSTKVSIVLHFDTVGSYKLPPVASRIKWGSYRLSFTPVTVLYNPQTIQPIIKYQIQESDQKKFYEGEKIQLLLTATFAQKVGNYSYQLNENSVFIPRQEINNLPLQIEKFSDVEYPILLLDFIPLQSGKITVPTTTVRTQTWNGIEKDIESEVFEINILPALASKNTELINQQIPKTESIVEDSELLQTSSEKILDQNELISDQVKTQVEEIAKLRILEKYSVKTLMAKEQRQQAEKKLQIEKAANESNYVTLFTLLSVTLVLAICLFIFIGIHKKTMIIIFFSFLLIFTVFDVIYWGMLSKDYAVVKDGFVVSVPEEKASPNLVLQPGTRVLVNDSTDEWAYIVYNDNLDGWIKKNNLVMIQK